MAKKAKVELTAAQKSAKAQAKVDRFKKLANKRVPKALKAIALVGNLTGSGYSYTPEQAAKIVKVMQAALDAVTNKFNGKSEAQSNFSV